MYRTPYNLSDYIHVSEIEEIVAKAVERIVESVVEMQIDRVIIALKEMSNVPMSSSKESDVNSKNDIILEKVRSSLDKIYTPDIIHRIKNDPNYHDSRSITKTTNIMDNTTGKLITLYAKSQLLLATKQYLTANNDPLKLGGNEEAIQDNLAARYEATYNALNIFFQSRDDVYL